MKTASRPTSPLRRAVFWSAIVFLILGFLFAAALVALQWSGYYDVLFRLQRTFLGPVIEIRDASMDGGQSRMLLVDRIAHGLQYQNEIQDVVAEQRQMPD